MTYSKHVFFFAVLCALIGACSDDPVVTPDATTTDTGSEDADTVESDPDAVAEVVEGEPRWTRPPGTASIVFEVDDRANQTYSDGEMEWNASLTYDAATNMVAYSASWLPEEGPYPALYDDGPYTTGGHEAETGQAGDNIFSLEVFFDAEEETVFDYGLINDLDHWIWTGANGQVTVSEGEAGTVVAPGFTFVGHGNVDLRVTLDTNALHEEFAFDAENDSLFVKGSMISWKPVQLLDNGERGDAAADDGVYTFTLSEYLGPHDGLLNMEQEAQFIFVFFEADGLEYKLAGNALVNGVTAYSDWDTRGTFAEEELLLRTESRGRALNTAIIVGPDEPDEIIEPVLRFVDPDRGPTTGGTGVSLTGENFATGAVVTFDEVQAECQVQSEVLITCRTPAHDRAARVPVTVENPDGASDTHDLGFTYVDVSNAPRIDSLDPDRGSELGGTRVTMYGVNFAEGATVTFDGELGEDVVFTSAEEISALTPRHGPGTVDVALRNPDSQTGTKTNAFTYEREGVDFATIQYPTSTVVGAPDSALPALFGRAYEGSVTEAEGRGEGLCGQLIYAPDDAGDPTEDDADWTVVVMDYNGDLANDDEYVVDDLAIAEPGTYLWAVRFTLAADCDGLDGDQNWTYGDLDGSGNGFSLDQAGTIVLTDGIRVSSLSPGAISLIGAAEITVSGVQLGSDLTVEAAAPDEEFASQAFTSDDSTSATLTFADPGESPRDLGRYDLRLTRDDDVLTIDDAFSVSYVRSPEVDGQINHDDEDWHELFLVAEADRESNWGDHVLSGLYVSFDERGLYLAVEGELERNGTESDPGNAIVVYVDTDFGSGTGFSQMSAIEDYDDDVPDTYWRIDRAITSVIDAGPVAGFGADFAFATMEFAPSDRDDYLPALTGWRGLIRTDLAWYGFENAGDGTCSYSTSCDVVDSTCAAGDAEDGVIETFIPWCTLYGADGLPDGGQQIAIFVRIVNRDGLFTSNQSLPMEPFYDAEAPQVVNEVFVLDVH